MHLHRFTDHWIDLQVAVQDWLDRTKQPPDDLSRYAGLICHYYIVKVHQALRAAKPDR